jgi:hypothetical protein
MHRLKTHEWRVLCALCPFFFLLTFFAKPFAYVSFPLGGFRLFISDLTLLVTLLACFPLWGRGELKRKQAFLVLLGIYLAFGTLRLGLSFFGHERESGVFQQLRDYALVYQSLWVLVGMALSVRGWTILLSVVFVAVGLAHGYAWGQLLILGTMTPKLGLTHLGGADANEVIEPLLPLVFAFWPARTAFAFNLLSGNMFAGQAFIYLKKTWFIACFVLGFPIGILARNPKVPSRSRRLKLAALAAGLGLALGVVGIVFVAFRSQPHEGLTLWSLPEEIGRAFVSFWRRYVSQVEDLVFHGELDRDGEGRVVSLMVWRFHLWKQAWSGFAERPWLGQGFGPHVVQTVFGGKPAISDGKWISGPHNSFLSIAFRVGIVGVLSLAGMMVYAARSWFRGMIVAIRKRSLINGVPEVLTACFVAMCLYAMFNVCMENPHYGIWFWLFLGGWAGSGSRDVNTTEVSS